MSKTQKGFVGIFIIVVIIFALMFFGIIRGVAARGCVSQTANCFSRASHMPIGDMILGMFSCVFRGVVCVFSSLFDWIASWFRF